MVSQSFVFGLDCVAIDSSTTSKLEKYSFFFPPRVKMVAPAALFFESGSFVSVAYSINE